MRYLKAVPRSSELATATRAVTLVPPDTRDVVYLDEATSLEIITEALRAWGLRVRSERTHRAEPTPVQPPAPIESNWLTTRSGARAPGRLENMLSPLWLPIGLPEPETEPVATWSWFSSAA
mgnify:CR=1 FL=1